jgi:hypothetical protein
VIEASDSVPPGVYDFPHLRKRAEDEGHHKKDDEHYDEQLDERVAVAMAWGVRLIHRKGFRAAYGLTDAAADLIPPKRTVPPTPGRR